MLKRLFFTIFTLIIATVAFAQQGKTITGTVIDGATGEPLIGAAVMEPGTTNGTITDINGNFTLKCSGNEVEVSYVGYVTTTVKADANGHCQVSLKSDNELEEVVVVGYGTQRKSDLTGSLSSMSEKDFKNYASSNVSGMMAGKAAGVFVSTSSGQPGADAVVRVRGLGTVNDCNPLYVVDGQFMDNMSSINPSDIERIEVLKDASACAIYGSRGSNGVILVTTKGGQKGATTVTFDAAVGMRNSAKALDMMNSAQYYDYITTAFAGDATFDKTKFTNQYKKGYDTDWWDECTHTALNQSYNVSVRSGSETSRTAFSLGYVNEQGTIIETEFQRLTARLSQEYDINKYITVGGVVNIAKMKKRDASSLPSFDFIQKADPFTPVINPLVDLSSANYEYNKWAPTEWSFDPNPVSVLKLNDRHNDQFNVFGNVFAKVTFTKDLSYRVQVSFERNHDTFYSFKPIYEAIFSDDMLGNRESKYNKDTQMANNSGLVQNYLVENRLNYNHTFGKHRLDLMGAMTYEKNSSEGIEAFKRGALGNDDAYRVLDAQTVGDKVSGAKETTSMLSYIARVNYSFDDRYLLTASFRADGSSRFAKNNRWGYFPSFSLGWRLSNEKFFQNSRLAKVFDSVKVRAGWGQNGNQRIDANAPLTLIGTDSKKQWYFGTGYQIGYVPVYNGNADIKWETSQQTNVGIDVTLLHSSLDMSIDFYIKNTKDMLLQRPIPSFGGYANDPYFNAGDLRNTGLDFVANYHNSIGKVNYHAGINLSTYKTKVTKLNGEYLTGSVSRTYEGGPIGRFYGFKQIGIFQNQQEIDSYVDKNGTKIQPHAKPGDFKFAKMSGEGELNDSDRTFIGDPNPDLVFGFNLGAEWKGLDVTLSFQGTLGNDIYNSAKGTLGTPGYQNALADAYTKAWRKEGDHAEYPRITTQNDNQNFRSSSFMVEDGSYLRLQNLQIGYTLPTQWMNNIKYVKSCRLYFSAQNLFTLTGYKGLDPDLGANSPLDMGYDNTRYPSSRAYMLGVNLTF